MDKITGNQNLFLRYDEMEYFNWYTIPVIAVILIVNMIFFKLDKVEKYENPNINKGIVALEQIGRFAVIFFMIFKFGIIGEGFLSVLMRDFWIVTIAILLLIYIVLFAVYFKKRFHILAMLLAIVPSAIFILTGLLIQSPPLFMFSIVFAIGHIYITAKNKM